MPYQILKFPEHFPAIRNLVFDDGLLHVTTYRRTDEGLECFVFNRDGEFLRKTFLPLVRENIFREYPYDIHDHTIYQLVEDDAGDGWDLYIRKME